MSKVVIALAVSLFGALVFIEPALAFPNPLKARLTKMQERLNLSDEQAEQVRDVFFAVGGPAECFGIDSVDEEIDCLMLKREAIHEGISQILSDEQLSKFEELRDRYQSRLCNVSNLESGE